MTPVSTKPPIAITLGDACGIGPEIIAKAYLQQPELLEHCLVWGDVGVMRRALSLVQPTGVPYPVAAISAVREVDGVAPRCIPVLQSGDPLPQLLHGRVDARAGAFAGQCVMQAAQAAIRGEVAAIVTAPLHKEALHAAGAPYDRYPGHTEMLQAVAASHLGQATHEVPVRMMLANDELRTVLVSIHMSLRNAIEAVTFDNVLQTLLITHRSLSRVLGRAPRIAVAGLNPHAGEGGLFGQEELQTIAPAIQSARERGCSVSGPWPPDTIFMQARKTPGQETAFDVVVAMYHDQGLIPVKYLGVDKGVNVTLGLPLVRTSPDHGTAFDIAGQGIANPESLLEAIRMARALVSA